MIYKGDEDMREILFRAKHIHKLPQNEHLDGRWVYGYLYDENYINSSELEGDILVDPETVCQYTGLTDKNGRKIFEGDIVKHFNQSQDDEKYVVGCIKWDQDSCKFVKEKKNGAKYTINNKCTYEVIGNIFDNPELLKG